MTDVVVLTDMTEIGIGRIPGAYWVATSLRNAGFTVQVVDFFARMTMAEAKAVADKYVDGNTLYVGVSTTMMNSRDYFESAARGLDKDPRYQHAHMRRAAGIDDVIRPGFEFWSEFVAYLRARAPKCKVVFGGSKTRLLLQHPVAELVDVFVHDEGEVSAVRLAQELAIDRNFSRGRRTIINSRLHYRWRDEFESAVLSMDASDCVAAAEPLSIETNRGCIFNCAFCSVVDRGKRPGELLRDPGALRQEITRSHALFGTSSFIMSDEMWNENPARVEALAEMAQTLPFAFRWGGYARLDLFAAHPATVAAAAQARLSMQAFGIETLHHRAGKAVGKGLGPSRVKETLHALRDSVGPDVNLSGFFIVGLPGETEDDIYRTVEWLESPGCPLSSWNFQALMFLPGSNQKMALDPGKFGYEIRSNMSWKSQWMDSETAARIVFDVMRRTERRSRVPGFSSIRLAGLLGEEAERRMTLADLHGRHAEILAMTEAFKQDYLKKLLG